ncbi:MAG: nicotinate-nucleotide adenylyltransferase [Chloroflexi bacterium]|nr:nicotinate-nucleotide adenylyltransferase [Chloroflexota bacterium]
MTAGGTGVFGGTFDPIHRGHLVVAEEIRDELGLTEVFFVPTGQPWLKSHRAISPAQQRLEMVRLATRANPHFKVSTIEIDRSGPSYTVDTMKMLRQQAGDEAELWFFLGSDVLAELPKWREPQRLIQLCRLAAFARPGFPLPRLEGLEVAIPGLSQRVTFVEVSQIDISGTDIRRRLAQGASIHNLVTEAVEKYIQEHGLYKEGQQR